MREKIARSRVRGLHKNTIASAALHYGTDGNSQLDLYSPRTKLSDTRRDMASSVVSRMDDSTLAGHIFVTIATANLRWSGGLVVLPQAMGSDLLDDVESKRYTAPSPP